MLLTGFNSVLATPFANEELSVKAEDTGRGIPQLGMHLALAIKMLIA